MSKQIMIVEDDRDFASSLELALEIAGYDALLAGSAEEAYALMAGQQETVRLAFFDVKLPTEDGISCFMKLQQQYPDLTGIVMTGFRDEEVNQRAQDAGFVEILLKPFKMARFMALAGEYGG